MLSLSLAYVNNEHLRILPQEIANRRYGVYSSTFEKDHSRPTTSHFENTLPWKGLIDLGQFNFGQFGLNFLIYFV